MEYLAQIGVNKVAKLGGVDDQDNTFGWVVCEDEDVDERVEFLMDDEGVVVEEEEEEEENEGVDGEEWDEEEMEIQRVGA